MGEKEKVAKCVRSQERNQRTFIGGGGGVLEVFALQHWTLPCKSGIYSMAIDSK